MFDDQPINNNNKLPPDLPVGEPEDIFSGTEEVEMDTMPNVEEDSIILEVPKEEPTALDAGVLRAKAENNLKPVENLQKLDDGGLRPIDHIAKPIQKMQETSKPQTTENMGDKYEMKEPGIGKAIMIGATIIVALILLIGGGWWLYATFMTDKITPTDLTITPTDLTPDTIPPVVEDSTVKQNETLPADILDDQLLFGSAVDSDGDGLDDIRESDIGTDPNNWDTDGDKLSDYDEVTIWKTDPINPDTDGDTYLDGAEVTSGYSPTGSGNLFDVVNLGTETGTSTK